MALVPEIQLTIPFDSASERRERELAYVRQIADYYGFKLVEADRCRAFYANTRTSGLMLARMDAKEREHYEEHRNRQIVRHLAEDIYRHAFVSFDTRDDHSSPYETDEITTGKLLVVKPRITHDKTNATD